VRRPGRRTSSARVVPATAREAQLEPIDLASRRLGGGVIAASDETFAPKESLVVPSAPAFSPGTFGPKGQIYDGWETRRRREPGHDWAIVRLGAPGVVRGVVVDTAFFTGNYPHACSVEGCWADGFPAPAELAGGEWVTLVPRSPLRGDTRNAFDVADPRLVTHVRLTIHPDGGVARLRVPGEVVPDPRRLLGLTLDLAAARNGGRVGDCSDRFYSSPDNVLLPGHAVTMGEGWETRRRRDEGNDWLVVRLAGAGHVRQAVLDTTHFVGNAPGAARLLGCAAGADPAEPESWRELLARTRLQPDTPHWFAVDAGEPVTHVRLDVYPDGGMARLRLYGELTADALAGLARRWWDLLPATARDRLHPGLPVALREILPDPTAKGSWQA
jgi:allantoicase